MSYCPQWCSDELGIFCHPILPMVGLFKLKAVAWIPHKLMTSQWYCSETALTDLTLTNLWNLKQIYQTVNYILFYTRLLINNCIYSGHLIQPIYYVALHHVIEGSVPSDKVNTKERHLHFANHQPSL